MKKNPTSKAGILNPRLVLAFSLCSVGALLAIASLTVGPRNATAVTTASGATIYVTTTVQKIGGIGTGGCSLQEAIYSSTLHDSKDGGAHGIAIDATDPDHFIITECTMGTGNGDTIILPSGGVFQLSSSLDGDAHNYMGPTATPMIFSTMTIEAAGATLEWVGKGNSRLFAIGQATVKTPNGTASGTGGVTIRNAYIKGFHVKGGDGGIGGGGGGLGAGGAIYVQNGTLVVENSTFDSNSAAGGNYAGSGGSGGGGGGVVGNGGNGGEQGGGGGGGGGARGNGGNGKHFTGHGDNGGGGGGTVFSGTNGSSSKSSGGFGGYLCGGGGGSVNNPDGHQGTCAGGGGGGGGSSNSGSACLGTAGDGGNGVYGGGGGGGSGNGGSGGFGGGGGGGDGDGCGGNGGAGGFGGGGGFGFSTSGPGPGPGGAFGGHGGDNGGGGGGALGGAIFNDSGSVTIHNSTFYNNSVVRGVGANNGGDAGGAIFSFFGHLTVIDSTVSGNQSTGSGGGIVVYTLGAATFTLNDTIIANNGANECFFTGNVTTSGVGNLIMSNGSGTQPFGTCPGVVTSVDPQLQPLQPPSTNGGKTPTMAIPLFSSAMGVADPGTSFPFDQRYADRPQPDQSPRNGFDIGAFEVCRRFFMGRLQSFICSETHITPPPTTTLTMQALPTSEGTTNPAPGTYNEPVNSVVAIQAIPNSGDHFTNWTGNVAQPSNPSTTVTMTQAQTVTANFDVGAPSADLQVTVSDGKSAAVAGVQNTYTIVVTNAGPSYITGAVVKDTFPSIFSGVTFTATETGGATGFTLSGSGNINNTVTMPPGSSITYKASGKLSASATGTVSDSASVTAPSGISDPNLSNNSATDTDNITIKADLKVTVSDGKTAATPGTTNTYTIVVTNAGPSKVIGAVINDTFPSIFTGVTYTATQSGGASGFTASGSGNITNTVTMPPASTITYKATGTISASATGSISDTATVTPPSGVTDPNTANNSATDTDTL